ncbi:MAG: tetratricopeptide repeat protein [Bacteroidota bacterium]
MKGQEMLDAIAIQNQIDSGNYYIYSDVEKTASFYTTAQRAAEKIENDTLLAQTYVGFAVMARLKAQYSKALALHQKALDIHLRLNDQRFIAADYHNIGALFRYTEDFEQAKQYLRKGLLLREAIQDSSELPISYMQIGVVCRKMKQLDSAAYYYDRAYEIARARVDREMLVKVNGNRAALEHFKKNYQKAIEINLLNIPYLKANENSYSLTTRYHNIARAYQKLDNYSLVIEYISKSIEIDQKEHYRKDLYKHLLLRSSMLRKQKDYRAALSDYRKYRKIRDTVQNLEQVEKFTAQKVAFEYEQQQLVDSLKNAAEQEKLVLSAKSERNQKNFYLITTILLFLTAGTIWYLLRSQRRFTTLELEKQQLEADLLQERLRSTEKEAERIVSENQYRTEQKRKLLHTIEELQKISKDQRIVKALNSLALGMNLQLTQEEQNLFYETSRDQFHSSFEAQLIAQFPILTKGEREICKLIRLNKSNKEIMELKGVTSASIRSTRYRIRKKLGLSRAQELEQFLKAL